MKKVGKGKPKPKLTLETSRRQKLQNYSRSDCEQGLVILRYCCSKPNRNISTRVFVLRFSGVMSRINYRVCYKCTSRIGTIDSDQFARIFFTPFPFDVTACKGLPMENNGCHWRTKGLLFEVESFIRLSGGLFTRGVTLGSVVTHRR